MDRKNLNELEEIANKRAEKRVRKKKPKMKISGASVKDLHRIINK